ncbi:MAG: TlpA family protein disulfide reductase [Paludibacteraceae bacterium]|nr:TlpA family protein disulfide reductase [Paludibacteraceae bacterium]
MKRIYFILCIALLFAACKKEDQSAKLMDEYQALDDRISEELKTVDVPEVADSIIDAYIDEAFALQQALPGSEAAYAILKEIYYLLDMERKQQAFAILDAEGIESHDLQRYFDAFQAEQLTMAGMPYTDFTAFTKDGEAVALSSLVDKQDFLLVDFWASWCGPCRRLMPGLKELAAKFGDKLAIVSVSVDEDAEAWQKTVEDLGLTWLQLRDTNDEGSKTYGITAIPHTVLINRKGIILAHNPEHEQVAAIINQ